MAQSAIRQPAYPSREQETESRLRTVSGRLSESSRTLVSPILSWRELLILFAVSLLGFWGGVPYYHPDFLTAFVGTVFKTGGNPRFFHYGCVMIYLHCLVYGATYVVMRLLGMVRSTAEFQQLIETEYFIKQPIEISAFVPGLLLTVLCSYLALVSVFWIATRITGRKIWGYAAAIALGTGAQWVADTHFLTVDVPMAAFVIASVALAMRLLERLDEGTLSYSSYAIILGACSGIIAGSKYPGGMIALSFFLVTVIFAPRSENRLKLAFLLPASALATFLLTSPFTILDFKSFWADFTMELVHAKGGHPGYMTDSFWFHTKVSLRDGFGVLGMALGVFGYIVFMFSRLASMRTKILLLLYPLLQFLLVSRSALSFQRYIVPVLPFLALFFAYGTYRITAFIRGTGFTAGRRVAASAVAIVLAGLVIIPNTILSIQTDLLLRGRDTRELFLESIRGRELGGFYVANYLKYFVRHRAPSADTRLNALFLDSFTYDRDIYEECRVEPELIPMFAQFDRVAIINPFVKDKTLVPFSPQSVFAPALPDLPLRSVAGPYIEIYYSSNGPVAPHFEGLSDPLVSHRPAAEGYYAKNLVRACHDVAKRKMTAVEEIGYRAVHSTRM